ncbi:ABC transporter ATP-binding protein [Aestuariibaculum marinum]|uniref:ABC transporter ATP-binding protein n=1 Tax=Aestuariibaculum marinum TaxID=2683592 RepID=UPI001F514423|nr:ABC transporter ATP-binding protein [Aestuariibaculum marinum]
MSKKFCKDLKTSLWYGVQDLFAAVRGNANERQLRPKEFWAVKDVSFELRRGECLGLIGHNGAGKSTLLKILNGLINPDAGSVTIKGKVGALIELGAGFNPILSGRENIYNNGAILGFTRKEIDTKLDAIIDFAEIREFIDMPVQHYSSGMKVRLGFAIAAQMEPDVLIIDEVLAVGDLGFVLKCFKTIDQLLPNTAVIFVSHSMVMISRICNDIMLLNHGEVQYCGKNVSKGIELYYKTFANKEGNVVFDDGSIELISCQVISEGGNDIINWNENLMIKLHFRMLNLDKMPFIKVFIFDKEERPVALIPNYDMYNQETSIASNINVSVNISNIQLTMGVYSIAIEMHEDNNKNPIYRQNNICTFSVSAEHDYWPAFCLDATWVVN